MMSLARTSREYVVNCCHDHDHDHDLFLSLFPFQVAVNLTSPVPLGRPVARPNAEKQEVPGLGQELASVARTWPQGGLAEPVAVDTAGSAGQATRCTSGRAHEGQRGVGNSKRECDAQMVQDVEVEV